MEPAHDAGRLSLQSQLDLAAFIRRFGALVHVWTAPRMQEENENFDGRVDCDHVSGLCDAAS